MGKHQALRQVIVWSGLEFGIETSLVRVWQDAKPTSRLHSDGPSALQGRQCINDLLVVAVNGHPLPNLCDNAVRIDDEC